MIIVWRMDLNGGDCRFGSNMTSNLVVKKAAGMNRKFERDLGKKMQG